LANEGSRIGHGARHVRSRLKVRQRTRKR
jgi:hypothetical protein